MKKRLEYEVLLNCILIEENIRTCFLFWCKKTYKISEYITKLFPNFVINRYYGSNKLLQLDSSDVLLISKRIIFSEEYDTDEKLGKLLGYLSAKDYITLDRTQLYYNYILIAYIDDIEIRLFDELCQYKLNYDEILSKVEKAFLENKLIKIQKVCVKERIINIV